MRKTHVFCLQYEWPYCICLHTRTRVLVHVGPGSHNKVTGIPILSIHLHMMQYEDFYNALHVSVSYMYCITYRKLNMLLRQVGMRKKMSSIKRPLHMNHMFIIRSTQKREVSSRLIRNRNKKQSGLVCEWTFNGLTFYPTDCMYSELLLTCRGHCL